MNCACGTPLKEGDRMGSSYACSKCGKLSKPGAEGGPVAQASRP